MLSQKPSWPGAAARVDLRLIPPRQKPHPCPRPCPRFRSSKQNQPRNLVPVQVLKPNPTLSFGTHQYKPLWGRVKTSLIHEIKILDFKKRRGWADTTRILSRNCSYSTPTHPRISSDGSYSFVSTLVLPTNPTPINPRAQILVLRIPQSIANARFHKNPVVTSFFSLKRTAATI